MSTENKSKYVTAEDVAAEFCISTATVYRGIKEGQIPAIRILTSIRIPRAWMESQVATFGPVIEDVHHNHPTVEPVKITIHSDGSTEADFDLGKILDAYEGRGTK